MPRIPTYDTRQVESSALPGVRQSSVASPALFSAAAEQQIASGKSMLNAGTQLAGIAGKMQDRENADLLFRAETALKDDYLSFEGEVRNNRKGQAAWGLTQDTEKFFAEQEKKHSGILTNDAQRQLFNQSVTRLRQTAVGSMSSYEAGERRRSLDESANASIVGSINLAAASAAKGLSVPATQDTAGNVIPGADPISGLKRDILNRVQVLASINGWAPERKQMEEQKHLTNLHKQVIHNLVDSAPDKARQYFETNKEEINGVEYDAIGKVLKVGETKQAGFDFVERTLGGGKGVPAFDWSAPDAYAQARTAARDFFKDDPDKRDSALREINTREAEAIQSRERAQRTAADSAWGIYGRTGNLNDVPAGVLASMDGKDFAAIKETAANKASGKGTVTDFATYYDLRQQALNDPEGFRKTDLRRYIGKLAPSDLEEMAKLQTAKPNEIKDAATLSQQLGNMHDMLMWGANDKEKKGAFDRAATDAIQTEARRRGKELTYEERQAVIDRMVISGEVVSGHWYHADADKRYYEVAGTEDAAKFAPEIPDTEKSKIEAALTRAGKPVTDGEVMRLFKQKHGIK